MEELDDIFSLNGDCEGETSELSDNEKRLQFQLDAIKLGINPEMAGDAVALALGLICDDVDFSAAMKKVTEKYPQMKVVSTLTTGVRTEFESDNSDMNMIRKVMGLK